jgi:hypothetical protein
MNTTYYAEPWNQDSNAAIAEFLGQRVSESEASEKACADGHIRNLWQIPKDCLPSLIDSEVEINIFIDKGNGIRPLNEKMIEMVTSH